MVDFHSHILPAMDDGSKSVEESLELLHLLKNQGVETVVASSHYYPEIEAVEEFLSRRKKSFNSLSSVLANDLPEIVLGAEVKFYPGISRMTDIEKLCIEGTNLLLLEMPFCYWTEFTVKEVINLSNMKNLKIVLAHIDRYLSFQNDAIWRRLLENGILMQVNADSFLNFFTRIKIMSFIKNQYIHFLGSDCHNLISRSPKIGDAAKIVSKKMGVDYINFMTDFALNVLNRPKNQ